MKLLLVILLNVLTVVLAIVVYDLVRDDGRAGTIAPDPNVALEGAVADISARLAALEEERREPKPIGSATLLAERLDALERSMAAVPENPGSPEAAGATEPKLANPSAEEPSPEEIDSFRRLAAAARQKERVRRFEQKVDATLDRLGIALTDDQKGQLVKAIDAFEQRRNEIWSEAKQRGMAEGEAVDWQRIIRDTQEAIEREFTERISGFLHITEAEAISAGLNADEK